MFATNASDADDIDIAAEISAMDLSNNAQEPHEEENAPIAAANDTAAEEWVDVDAEMTNEAVDKWIDELTTL